MTQTTINTKSQIRTEVKSLGLNVASNKRPIGIVSYNSTNGRVIECEVYAPFWEGGDPNIADMVKFLFSKGYGMIRANTLAYNSLV